MTLSVGTILVIEGTQDGTSGLQRKFKVTQYSWPSKDETGKETQLVRLEVVE